MERISWIEKITNMKVLRMNWVGHVMRGNELLGEEVPEGRMLGMRRPWKATHKDMKRLRT